MFTPSLVVRFFVHLLMYAKSAKKALILKIAVSLSFASISIAKDDLTATDVFSGASQISSTEGWSKTELEILAAMNIAEAQGVPFNFYGQDFSPQTLIDLYLPKVHLLTDQARLILPSDHINANEVKFFFAAHQVFNGILGFPRVSLQDLSASNREETRAKLVQALIKRIAFVAALSQRYDLDWFTSWAARNSYALQTPENAGSSFIHQHRNSEHLFDITLGAATGETKKSKGIIRSIISSPIIKAGLSTLNFKGPSDFTTLGEELADKTSPEAIGEMNAVMTPQSYYANYEALANDLADLLMDSEFVNFAEQMELGTELSEWESNLEAKIQKFNSNQFPFESETTDNDLQFEGKKQRLSQKVQRLAFKLYQLQKNGNKELDTLAHVQFLAGLRRDIQNSANDQSSLDRLEQRYETELRAILANRHTNSQIPSNYLVEERSFIKANETKFEKVLQALRLADIDQVNRTHRERLTAFGHDWSQAGIAQLDTDIEDTNSDNTPVVIDAPREMDYIQRLVSLRDAVFHRVNFTFLPMVEKSNLPEDTKRSIRTSLSEYLELFSQKVSQAINRYSQEFLNMEASEDKAKVAVKMSELESHMTRSLHQNFKAMVEISKGLDAGKRKFRKPLASIKRTIKDLKTGSSIYIPILHDILDQFPMRARLFGKVCTYISKLCIKNQPLTDFIRNRLTFADVSRTGKPVNFTGIPVEKIKDSLPDDAVVIIVANHDYAPLDAKVLDELSRQLEAKETMFLTTKLAYPHFFLRKNTDPNTFFIQDRTWMAKSMRRMSATKGRTVFNIFPEGTLPYWFAQFPLVAKAGGFVVARRAAHRLRDKKKVFVLEVQTNILPYMINNEKDELTAEILPLVEVPTDEVERDDAWVSEMRHSFENRTNYHRGESSPVIVKPELLEDSRLHKSESLITFVRGAHAAHPYRAHPSGEITNESDIVLGAGEVFEKHIQSTLGSGMLCESYFL